MSCQCEVFEVCPDCVPLEEYVAIRRLRDKDLNRRITQPSKSYTLADIEQLAREWATENEATTDARWIVSSLIAWLQRRERERNR